MCFRNNNCVIRSHNHCNGNCKIKHNMGEKCVSRVNVVEKLNKNEIEKKYNKLLIDEISRKYGFNDIVNECLSNKLKFNAIERTFLYDTFLSNKAITKEVSVDWIRNYLIMSEKYGGGSCFIIFAELLTSHRHDFILSSKKFIKVLEKKYMEAINGHGILVEEFKKAFFKDVLKLILKNRE